MYGWMKRWLKGEGDGKPIPEPEHEVEKVEDLACYEEGKARRRSCSPCTYAAGREAKRLLAAYNGHVRDHREAWEATAGRRRALLELRVLGGLPKARNTEAKLGDAEEREGVRNRSRWRGRRKRACMTLASPSAGGRGRKGKVPACVLPHPDGKAEAMKNSCWRRPWWRRAAIRWSPSDLRATGRQEKWKGMWSTGALDHTSSERGGVGRLATAGAMDIFDIHRLLDWMAAQPGLHAGAVLRGRRRPRQGSGRPSGAAAADERFRRRRHRRPGHAGHRRNPTATGWARPRWRHDCFPSATCRTWPLGAPRRLVDIAGGVTPQGKKLGGKQIEACTQARGEVVRAVQDGRPLDDQAPKLGREELAAMLVG